jgi:hypothetical protein
MSTFKKLAGKQGVDLRDKRKAALAFYRQMADIPGPPGKIAAAVFNALRRIHNDSTLNTFDKDREFKRLIGAVQQRNRVEAGESGGSVPARDEVPAQPDAAPEAAP